MEKSIYSAEYQQLCRLLRELRQEAGLTQVQLAERLGVPQSFVSKYETGERRLDVVELRHIVESIGASFADFVSKIDSHLRP
ncbi:helix-turn-helix domain-containing protein [Amycolatopsis thermalba]|uniref:Helix-turn-helix domain-containing protein n=1 Tax=Amycolatopsis thermalba TaxID=944492 RepID=A0ABY4P3E6_9PSEU|nr:MULTISPECIES: helix-turn-helix transcriptional regulator [Amycolatopsis]UQS26874.1 helix-turn-helix domain-containing protein [Amycolatopsis thermalba]